MPRIARTFLITIVLLSANRATLADFASINLLQPSAGSARDTVALPYVGANPRSHRPRQPEWLAERGQPGHADHRRR